MRTATVFLLCLLMQVGRTQTTFNVVQQHPSTLSYNGATSVFELADGYLVFSFGWALDSSRGAIQVTKFALDGEFLWQQEHTRTRHIYAGLVDPISRTLDGSYIAAVDEYGGSEPIDIWLYWFNADGDTIRTKFLRSDTLFSSDLTNHGTRQLVALSDGGFLHCGWCAGLPVGTGGCVTRLDSTGAILWVRNYPQSQYIFNATELPDGGFVLGGSRNTQQDMAVVIRTDSLGNAQWVRYHGLFSNTGGLPAHVDDAGNFLMAGSWKDDPLWSVYSRWASLYKYSPTGTLLDRKDYYFSYNATAVFILPKSADRYWLIGGMNQYIVNPDGVTTLWELDENLDSLWMRRYWYYEPDGAFSAAYSVRSTSDGGLVMCGATRQGVTDPLPYLQSNWLLKLDEHGCLVPGCHTVGIEEHVLGLNQYLHVYPNPIARGQAITFTFAPPEGFAPTGALRAVLLDAQGRTVHEELLRDTTGLPMRIGMTTDNFSSGVYYLHLTDGTRWLAGGKVLCAP